MLDRRNCFAYPTGFVTHSRCFRRKQSPSFSEMPPPSVRCKIQPQRIAPCFDLRYVTPMKSKSNASSRLDRAFVVRLSENDLGKLDTWIAAQPDPKPSQGQAVLRVLKLGLIHANEAAFIEAHIADADKQIRAQFDLVLGMIEHVVRAELPEQMTSKKLN